MSDFRNFRNYRSPQVFRLIHIVYVWDNLNRSKIKSPTYNCAQRNYSRLAAAVLKTDCNRLGQSQTVGIHPGNRSDTWGIARKNNFRFALWYVIVNSHRNLCPTHSGGIVPEKHRKCVPHPQRKQIYGRSCPQLYGAIRCGGNYTLMDANRDSPRGDCSDSRPPSWNTLGGTV